MRRPPQDLAQTAAPFASRTPKPQATARISASASSCGRVARLEQRDAADAAHERRRQQIGLADVGRAHEDAVAVVELLDRSAARAARSPAARERPAAATVALLGLEERDLDADLVGHGGVPDDPPQEAMDARRVVPELVRKEGAVGLNEGGVADGFPVAGAQARVRGHDRSKDVLAGQVHGCPVHRIPSSALCERPRDFTLRGKTPMTLTLATFNVENLLTPRTDEER